MADTRNRPTDPSREERERSGSNTDPSRREGQQRQGQQQREQSERSERERSGGSGGSRNRPEGDVEGIGGNR